LPVGWTPEKTRSTIAMVSFPRLPVSRRRLPRKP
jgi:hypothetical protein